jgi:hypothetical protein
LERFATLAATVILPGEGKTGDGQTTFSADRRRLLSLLVQGIVNSYRALFLSRSYVWKMASTSSRDIDTPLL